MLIFVNPRGHFFRVAILNLANNLGAMLNFVNLQEPAKGAMLNFVNLEFY